MLARFTFRERSTVDPCGRMLEKHGKERLVARTWNVRPLFIDASVRETDALEGDRVKRGGIHVVGALPATPRCHREAANSLSGGLYFAFVAR